MPQPYYSYDSLVKHKTDTEILILVVKLIMYDSLN